MAIERRRSTDIRAQYAELYWRLSNATPQGITSTPYTFAHRKFLGIKGGVQRWRLLKASEIAKIDWLKPSIIKARIDIMARVLEASLTPSSPMAPPTHSLSVISRDGAGLNTFGVIGIGAMSQIFHSLVADHKYRWLDDDTIYIDGLDIRIKSPQLEGIVEAEPTTLPYDITLQQRIAKLRGEERPVMSDRQQPPASKSRLAREAAEAEEKANRKPSRKAADLDFSGAKPKLKTKAPTTTEPREAGAKLTSADRRKLRAAGLKAPYSAEDIKRVLG